MYMCIHIYLYVHTYICIYKSLYMYIYVYMSETQAYLALFWLCKKTFHICQTQRHIFQGPNGTNRQLI